MYDAVEQINQQSKPTQFLKAPSPLKREPSATPKNKPDVARPEMPMTSKAGFETHFDFQDEESDLQSVNSDDRKGLEIPSDEDD